MSGLLVDRCRDIARRISEGELSETAGAMEMLTLIHERERQAGQSMADRIIGTMRRAA
jgi:hypothetical protein